MCCDRWTKIKGRKHTHCGTAHEDDDESPDDASDSHQPGHPEEEDHAEDVLDARQVDTHQSAELGGLEEDEEKRYSWMTVYK